jgi:hypothetical protein
VILSEEPSEGIDDDTDEDGMPVSSRRITYRRIPIRRGGATDDEGIVYCRCASDHLACGRRRRG